MLKIPHIYVYINMNSVIVLFLLIVTVITTVVDDVDLAVSSIFFNGDANIEVVKTYFFNPYFLRIIHKAIPFFVITLVIFLLISLVLTIKLKKQLLKRRVIYLLLCLIIGPGLIVNTIFKENFGRARPSQIIEFGGTKLYSKPFAISNQCKKNCSFVSGHASVGFYVTAFAYLGKFRPGIYLLGLWLGMVTGLIRIAQGGHYISDVTVSGLVVLTVNYLLYILYLKPKLNKKKATKNAENYDNKRPKPKHARQT